MTNPSEIRHRLLALQTRMDALNRAWTRDNYEALLRFYVAILPRIMDSERCTIFMVEPGTDRIWSLIGTGIREREIEAPKQESLVGRAISTGQWVIENSLSSSVGYHLESDYHTGFVTRNLVCVPIRSLTGHGVTGAIQVLNRRQGNPYHEADGALLQEVADYLAMAIENILINQEMLRISNGLNQQLEEFRTAYLGNIPFIAESPAMRGVLETVRMVSDTPVSVFIHGENGTGKEVIARMIHENSAGWEAPFVAVNCASIPETLMESEFFGYERGAFTGAHNSRPGRFEEASGGTLFLDEVADMPLSIQPKFLRAIQEGEGNRLGSNQLHKYDMRIISATNRDLSAAVQTGEFREDLFYRLFAVEIYIPPLRERPEDVSPLAHAYLADISHRFNKHLAGFDKDLMDLFEAYNWPGNVRQLRREVERLVALTPEGQSLRPATCSEEIRTPNLAASAGGGTLELPERVRELEVDLINRALEKSHGNKVRASRLLGITRQGLHKKIKRYNIPAGNGTPATP